MFETNDERLSPGSKSFSDRRDSRKRRSPRTVAKTLSNVRAAFAEGRSRRTPAPANRTSAESRSHNGCPQPRTAFPRRAHSHIGCLHPRTAFPRKAAVTQNVCCPPQAAPPQWSAVEPIFEKLFNNGGIFQKLRSVRRLPQEERRPAVDSRTINRWGKRSCISATFPFVTSSCSFCTARTPI